MGMTGAKSWWVAAVVGTASCAGVRTEASPVAFGAFPNNSTHSSAAVAAAIANVPLSDGLVSDVSGRTDDIEIYNFGAFTYSGEVDVTSTLNRIRAGDFFLQEVDDGGFFNFKPTELPNIPRKGTNYYMEFVVWPSVDLTTNTNDPAVLP